MARKKGKQKKARFKPRINYQKLRSHLWSQYREDFTSYKDTAKAASEVYAELKKTNPDGKYKLVDVDTRYERTEKRQEIEVRPPAPYIDKAIFEPKDDRYYWTVDDISFKNFPPDLYIICPQILGDRGYIKGHSEFTYADYSRTFKAFVDHLNKIEKFTSNSAPYWIFIQKDDYWNPETKRYELELAIINQATDKADTFGFLPEKTTAEELQMVENEINEEIKDQLPQKPKEEKPKEEEKPARETAEQTKIREEAETERERIRTEAATKQKKIDANTEKFKAELASLDSFFREKLITFAEYNEQKAIIRKEYNQ